MVTESYFRQYYESLYANKEVYLWGANHELITKDLCDRLYRSYGSSNYNKTYYNNKLKEGAGRYGSDCSGSICPLSKGDNTAKGYYNTCKTKGNINQIPLDRCCLVFNAKFTHVGAYLGNGITIEMKSSKENCVKQNLDKSRWAYYGIPSWLKADESSDSTSISIRTSIDKDVIKNVQTTINNYLTNYKHNYSPIKVDGAFGPKTLKAATMAFQAYINNLRGSNLALDGEFGGKTKRSCPSFKNGSDGLGVFLIQALLYVKGYNMNFCLSNKVFNGKYDYNMTSIVCEYQSNTRGLRQDGIAGGATCYELFNN